MQIEVVKMFLQKMYCEPERLPEKYKNIIYNYNNIVFIIQAICCIL